MFLQSPLFTYQYPATSQLPSNMCVDEYLPTGENLPARPLSQNKPTQQKQQCSPFISHEDAFWATETVLNQFLAPFKSTLTPK